MNGTNRVELITIGREILDGRVLDTNAVAMAEVLRTVGLVPRFGQRVDDEMGRIVESFQIASKRAQIILVTGGLGPTSDDLTAEAFAKFLGEKVICNPEALAQIEALFQKYDRPLTDVQRKQAFIAPSCFILENTQGTAPGFGLERDGLSWFFMPGVPHEMLTMLKNQVLPRIKSRGAQNPKSMTWATQFTSEGGLQKILNPIEKLLPAGFELTYRTRFPENHIGLYADCSSNAQDEAFEKIARQISTALGDDVFTTARGLERLQGLEDVVVNKLTSEKRYLCTVESCTGGLVANRITNVAGSSAIFFGSYLTYDNLAKEALGVPRSLLVEHGAVSAQVAQKLAESGLRALTSSGALNGRPGLCIATTGIAGPGGGSSAKPVGLCFIALAQTGSPTEVEEVRARINLSREWNKLFFAQKALDMVRRSKLS